MGSAELYDPASGTWSATASMIAEQPSHGHVAVQRQGARGKRQRDGVRIDDVMLASAELYDPGSGN